MIVGLLPLVRALIELAEAEVAVSGERAHSELGQLEGLTVVVGGLGLWRRRLASSV